MSGFKLGGTVAQAQAGIVIAINRVNEIYERDLGIRLMLVGNNDQLIENGGNVSFTNGDVFAMLDENQVWLDQELTSWDLRYRPCFRYRCWRCRLPGGSL